MLLLSWRAVSMERSYRALLRARGGAGGITPGRQRHMSGSPCNNSLFLPPPSPGHALQLSPQHSKQYTTPAWSRPFHSCRPRPLPENWTTRLVSTASRGRSFHLRSHQCSNDGTNYSSPQHSSIWPFISVSGSPFGDGRMQRPVTMHANGVLGSGRQPGKWRGTSTDVGSSSGSSFPSSGNTGGRSHARSKYLAPSVRVTMLPPPAAVANGNGQESHPSNGTVRGAEMVWEDTVGQQLQRRAHIVWEQHAPRRVFIVKKSSSLATSQKLKEIAVWLEARGMQVLVERAVHRVEFPEYQAFDVSANGVDICITLGGDGTVLHLASLFVADEPLPPVVSFAMGTLGFLTPFDVTDFAATLNCVWNANQVPVYCTLRTRKCCEVFWQGQLQRVHHVLNECLIDRGASPSMVTLEVSIDGHHVTTVQADGLIVATPSGSTAYSLSAGGPMVAPSVPGTLITPIAPHSLSFRPLVVPESSQIIVHLPLDARSHARASFDGRHTMRMMRDTSIRCSTSLCALPMICLGHLDRDWYEGITQKLKWNVPIRGAGRLPPMPPVLPPPQTSEQLWPLPSKPDKIAS